MLMCVKVNNSPKYYDNELIYAIYHETVHSLYAKECAFVLFLQLEKSTILRGI